jgi:hypothetical protein
VVGSGANATAKIHEKSCLSYKSDGCYAWLAIVVIICRKASLSRSHFVLVVII